MESLLEILSRRLPVRTEHALDEQSFYNAVHVMMRPQDFSKQALKFLTEAEESGGKSDVRRTGK